MPLDVVPTIRPSWTCIPGQIVRRGRLPQPRPQLPEPLAQVVIEFAHEYPEQKPGLNPMVMTRLCP